MAIRIVPTATHITRPPSAAPIIIPGHQAFDGSKMTEPRNTPHQTSQKRNVTSIPMLSAAGSGKSTSPLRRGVIRSIPSASPCSYFPALNFGVKFSSIILWDMRSVITPSSPRPTSIRISRSVGATSIRRPLSSHFWPIHHERASTIQTSSIVLSWRDFIITMPIWWFVSFSSVRIFVSRADFSSDERSPTSS